MVAPATPAGASSSLSTFPLANATLTLTAVDTNSFAIAGALSVWITQLPSHGSLYQTSDGITLGPRLTSVPAAITNPNLTVIYVNTAAPAIYSGLSVLYIDVVLWQPRLTYNGTVIKSALSKQSATYDHRR